MQNISKAIIAVMTEINWVAKSMDVWTGSNSYKWVSDKDVKILMREAMIKQWLSILPISVIPKFQVDRWEEVDQYSKSTPKDMKSKQSIFTEVTTRYLLLHTSWESIELAGYGHWVDAQDKWAGKATTYALKNTLLNMFLVPTGVDTDDTHSDELPTPKTKSVYTWATTTKWLNFKELKQAIDWGTDTEVLLTEWIKDNEYTLSGAMKTCIRTYCDTGELIAPEFKK